MEQKKTETATNATNTNVTNTVKATNAPTSNTANTVKTSGIASNASVSSVRITPTSERVGVKPVASNSQSGRSVNYATEKLLVEKSVRKWKLAVLFSVVGILLAFCVFGAFVNPSSWKYYFDLPTVKRLKQGECRVHFLDVGQGDCTLVEFENGQTVLIDGGPKAEETVGYVLRYLNALKIKKLDAVIATHTDEDHCGGLLQILKYKKVGKVFLPKADPFSNLNHDYAEFYNFLLDEEIDWAYADRTARVVDVSDCTFSILYPYKTNVGVNTDNQESNAQSVVAWLDYYGSSVLFAGDMPTETEDILMRDERLGVFKPKGVLLSSTEVLKVSHHGSRYATSEEFLQYLHLEKAVISCGENNIYDHPDDEVLQRLESISATTYRTDTHGSIVVTMRRTERIL